MLFTWPVCNMCELDFKTRICGLYNFHDAHKGCHGRSIEYDVCSQRALTSVAMPLFQVGDKISIISPPPGEEAQPSSGLNRNTASTANRTAPAAVYVLEHSHSETYFHFVVQALPRLEYMWPMISEREDIKIFQTSIFAPLAFDILGLTSERLFNKRHTFVPRIFVAPPTTSPLTDAETARVMRMSSRLTNASDLLDVGPTDHPSWVVINRTGARARAIVNHEELMSGLRSSFPNVTFREFANNIPPASVDPAGNDNGGSLAHSIESFHSCWGIIAPHGAGLSNLIFVAKKNISVVEVVGLGQTMKVYAGLSERFGHRHSYVSSPYVTWEPPHMVVDVPAVLKVVAGYIHEDEVVV